MVSQKQQAQIVRTDDFSTLLLIDDQPLAIPHR
jgi:hypothetical protein